MKTTDKHNFLGNVLTSIPDEIFETIISTSNIKIERIISKGHKSEPDFWYNQDQLEWILILKGEAKLQFEEKTMLREEIQKLVEYSISSEEAAKLIVIYLEEEAELSLDGNGWLEDDSCHQESNEDSENEDIKNLRQKLETTLA